MAHNQLAFGAWQLGGPHIAGGRPNGWSAGSESDRIAMVSQAVDIGIRFFDTAYGYGDGESERLLGDAIKVSRRRQRLMICSKVPPRAVEGQDWPTFRTYLDTSLERLQTEALDVLLLHNPAKPLLSEATLDLFNRAQKEGLIKDFGISARLLEDLEFGSEMGFGSYFQWNYSVLERRFSGSLAGKLKQRGHNFIARSVLYRGLITERFLALDPEFEFDDARAQFPIELRRWCHEHLTKLQPLAHSVNLSLSEFAIAAALSNQDLQYTLVGISKAKHLQAMEKLMSLSIGEKEEIAGLFEQIETQFPRNFDFQK